MSDVTIPTDDAEGALIQRLTETREKLLEEMHRVIVGQDDVLEQLLLAILCRGHCLLEGVPGLAKTVMVQTLSQILELSFSRVQFTPDMMPSDITGTDIIQEDPETGRRQFEFMQGPLFAHLVLADEINRTPPKTQAALLEAVQERRVTARGRTYDLPEPFFVLATQNPIEQEGTYALPEAQLDRFMFLVRLNYPDRAEEIEILRRTTSNTRAELGRLFTGAEVQQLQQIVREVPVAEHVFAYAVDLVQSTRPGIADIPDATQWLQWGAGPRAGQQLITGAKARAVLDGRFHATIDDINALAKPVLRHRIVANFAAQGEGIDTDTIIERLVAHWAATTNGS
jgi:MoxR-like ATPase